MNEENDPMKGIPVDGCRDIPTATQSRDLSSSIPARRQRSPERVKRLLDIVFAALGLVALSPLFLLIALLIKLSCRGSIIYAQVRVGKDRQNFMLIKFRTMIEDAEVKSGPVWAGENDDRVSSIGRILRTFGLDELPQLWLVLIGKMSLVGPRPERPHFVEILEKEIPNFDGRHQVLPGITGLAQIRLGYCRTIEESREKLKLDLQYIAERNLWMDLKILVLSPFLLVFRRIRI